MGIGGSSGGHGEYGDSDTKSSTKTNSSSLGLTSATTNENSENIGVSNSDSLSKNVEENYNTGLSKNIGGSNFNSLSKGFSLTNNVNLEDTNEKVISKRTEIIVPSQEININPKNKITITSTIERINFKTIFDLKQDIYGNVNFSVYTNENEIKNFTFSIGKLIKKLEQYDLLPREIGLYEDEQSIYFDGKLYFSIKKGFNANINVGEEQELFN